MRQGITLNMNSDKIQQSSVCIECEKIVRFLSIAIGSGLMNVEAKSRIWIHLVDGRNNPVVESNMQTTWWCPKIRYCRQIFWTGMQTGSNSPSVPPVLRNTSWFSRKEGLFVWNTLRRTRWNTPEKYFWPFLYMKNYELMNRFNVFVFLIRYLLVIR